MEHVKFSRTHEQGAAPIKTIIIVVILGAIIYAGIVMVPIYAKYYNLKDDLKGEILFANDRFREDIPKGLTRRIYEYLDDMEAVYEKSSVKVNHDEPNKYVSVEVWYSMPHNLPFFPKDFYIQTEGKYGL